MFTVLDTFDKLYGPYNDTFPFQKDICDICKSLGVKYRVILSSSSYRFSIDKAICDDESCMNLLKLQFAEYL